MELLDCIHSAYPQDKKLGRIVAEPSQHPKFRVWDSLLYFSDRNLLCVPEMTLNRCRATEIIIDLGHSALGHMGHVKTLAYVRQWYWWPT
ncbi:hypothetical protein BDV93DRAFT_416016, partial [Ceratobasidium sp. AG-I]